MFPRIALKRLVVLRGKDSAYDEKFHDGINIIHSSTNSCGKSTIADFIFFILGGEIKEWKGYAGLCDTVYAEIQANDAVMTLRRNMHMSSNAVSIFFDTYEKSLEANILQWEEYPLYRRPGSFSFTQVMFKSLGIPEAKSDEASNVTMHQILRILYVDQMTPVQRIFRMEDWDPPIIREVVGNILCGIGGYDLYEKQLRLRTLDKEFSDLNSELRAMIRTANAQGIDVDLDSIKGKMETLQSERNSLYERIRRIPEEDVKQQVKQGQEARKKAAEELAKIREQYVRQEENRKTLEFEIEDSQA